MLFIPYPRVRNLPSLRGRIRRLGRRAISDDWCIIPWCLDYRPVSLILPSHTHICTSLYATEPQSPFLALFCLNFGSGEVFPVVPIFILSVGFDTLIVFSECTTSVDSLSPVNFAVACLSPSYMTYITYALISHMLSVGPERS